MVFNDEEQNNWKEGFSGLFHMLPESKCSILKIEDNGITLMNAYRTYKHIRKFIIEEDAVKIVDYGNKPFIVNINQRRLYSNGYGKKLNSLSSDAIKFE